MTPNEDQSGRIAAIIERLAEQPQLLEQVAAILETEAAPSPAVEEAQAEAVPTAAPASNDVHDRDRRHKLLSALRPYLSERRAKALDSFEAIAGVMDFMKQA